ncbi:MAG: hypothetical protein AAF581_23080, partial [Planctomycetota bacterium]
ELLDDERSVPVRRRAARLLELFKRLHGGETPFYLRHSEARARRYLSEQASEWVRRAVEEFDAAVAGVPRVGVDLFPGKAFEPTGSDDYYRELIRDGYLDIAIIGGNSRSAESGRYYSWDAIEQLRGRLAEIGFKHTSFLDTSEKMLSEKVIHLLGQRVRVRVNATGGSRHKYRIRRAVANFVEGLAHADVVIYNGHSNKQSGCYYISESKSRFSRFRIGLGEQEDLAQKCHGLCSKTYQFLSLQSCFSFDKYCRPLETYMEREMGRRPGVLGTWRESYFNDFLPRTTTLIELLLEGRGARDIFRTVDAIRPYALTPPLQMRGLLQPRETFIVPAGVTIADVAVEGRAMAHRVSGLGSDGRRYYSTEIFAQNNLGEVVQVVPHPKGVVALYRDGSVYYCGVETGGAMQELPGSKRASQQMRFIGWAEERRGARRLYAIDTEGGIHALRKDGQVFIERSIAGARTLNLVAISNDEEGRLTAIDHKGTYHTYTDNTWTPLPSPVPLPTLTPTLLPTLLPTPTPLAGHSQGLD